MSVVTDYATFDAVLDLLGDGCWHTEKELEEVSYFPRSWVDELMASGYDVETRDIEGFLVRLVAG